MHYNSFKSRCLRVMLLSLVFLLTAGQLNAKVVYFKNIIPDKSPWEQPYVHYFGGQDGTSWPGKAMEHVEGDWWKYDIGNNNGVIFNNGNNGQQTHDLVANSDTETAFVCSHWDEGKLQGNWTTYTEPTPVGQNYYLKHPWGGGNWEWKQLTANGDGTYSVIAQYGNNGCDWNTKGEDNGKSWIGQSEITFVGNPASGDQCKFTFNPSTKALTITKLGAEAINEIYIFGSLDFGETWDDSYGAGRKMTDAGNGIFTYDFTMGFSGQTYYAFHAKTNYDNYKFLRNDVNTEVALGGTAAYAMYSDRDDKSYSTNGFLKNGRYRITVNTNDKTIGIVLLEEPAYTPVYSTVYIFGDIADKKWDENKCSILLNDNKGIFSYAFRYEQGMGNGWAFRVQKADDSSWKTICNNSADLTLENELDINEHSTRGDVAYYSNHMQPGHVYTVYLNTNTGKVYLREGGKYGIPVYPRGVHSEAELDAYDFTANPVVYLVSNMLNNNRVTPEWQMVRDANGNYHLDGFAARTGKGKNNYRARVYTAKDEFFETAAVELDFDDNNANLSEGKLYNASVTVSDGNYTLSLTEDASAQGRMPFIGLVGYAMQQDQDYKTPRAFEGHPATVSTSKGWQEAWLQYDENGNLVKDREGNVMYTTMWPPKNPVYFTANIGGERLYTSENMTFKPVTSENGTYVGKTGADWMNELKSGEEAEAYNGLNLDANTVYYRYVVPEIWYVGSAKIWTGWNGEAINDSGWKAMWSYHRNWGYSNRKSSDTDGTGIDAETTYGVSTAEGSNGNFKFDNPTYFKTIEFFYSTEHPNTGSKIYTTLAFGNAQIEAQSHKNNDKYDYGQYKPSVKPGEGVNVASYIIRCYDAATGKLVTLNNGIVAQGEGNPSNTNFLNDREGLAEGKYYYEMEVVFNIEGTDKQRTTTVRSNPFIIHFPGVYTLEPVAQQLAQMGTDPNGYVSYSTSNEAIYHVTLNEAGEIERIAPVAEGERAELYKNNFGKNEGINWSDKVLVVAPVPAQFKLDAEKAEPAVSLETISTYDVTDNGTHKVVAKRNDGSLAYVANANNFDSKAFNAVMKYQDITTSAPKVSEGKAVTVEMMRPNPKTEAANVTVEKVTNTDNITVDGKAVATDYYKVCVNLNFGNANVTANSDQPAFMVYNGTSSKLYTAEAGKSYFTLSYAAVDPVEFTKANVEVAAVYKDKAGNYTLAANMGDAVSANAQMTGFVKDAVTEISKFELANVVDKDEANHLYVTKLATATTGKDNINGTDLDVDQYRMRFKIDEQPVAMATYFNSDTLNFEIENVNSFDPKDAIELNYSSAAKKATVYIAPMYPVLVNGTMTVNNLVAVTSSAAGAPVLKAEPMYIALYGNEAQNEIEATEGGTGGIVTGINDITSKDVQSVRFVNVAGQMSDKPFEGMNIMVTTYTDGTITTAKVIK